MARLLLANAKCPIAVASWTLAVALVPIAVVCGFRVYAFGPNDIDL